jgi:hypothetical protein
MGGDKDILARNAAELYGILPGDDDRPLQFVPWDIVKSIMVGVSEKPAHRHASLSETVHQPLWTADGAHDVGF